MKCCPVKRHHWRWMQITISDVKSITRRNVWRQRDWDGVYCLFFCSTSTPWHAQASFGSRFWRDLQASLPAVSSFQKDEQQAVPEKERKKQINNYKETLIRFGSLEVFGHRRAILFYNKCGKVCSLKVWFVSRYLKGSGIDHS